MTFDNMVIGNLEIPLISCSDVPKGEVYLFNVRDLRKMFFEEIYRHLGFVQKINMVIRME